MASTFSPSLKLELIGDGDQSGIWGQTTNNNLGTLLEQAIAGVVTITMTDTNYTLTSFNGVADEARNAVIIATGTNSAQRNIIAPLVEKTYIIRNSTTGGFAVQIIGASGTGVVIPNGVTAMVYCDGTNFLPAQVNSIGNQTINGNLAVTGTTTLTGALTASTGSFSGVLTAPTATPGTNTTQVATTAFVQTFAGTLGTMATQNANNVNITGGAIAGVTLSTTVTGTTQAVTTNNTTLATTAFVRSIIPAGVILMWSGSVASIPSGWLLCNGSNGTPDLRDRFIVGAGSSYAVGATGGTNTNVLTTSQLPIHDHTYTNSGTTSTTNVDHTHSGTTNFMNQNSSHTHTINDPGHQHIQGSYNARPVTGTNAIYGTNDPTPDAGNQFTVAATTGITINATNTDHQHAFATGGMASNVTHNHTFSFSGTTSTTGANASIENRPPYFALCYIMKS